MQRKTEDKKFATSCFITAVFGFFTVTIAFLIYFYFPSVEKEDPFPPVVAFEIPLSQEAEEEIEQANQLFTEVSFAAFNNTSDKGLTLYRSSISRSSVITFYTKITGNRDVAIAILTEAERNNIPISLAFALAYTESKYKTGAVGHNVNGTTDRGLFQLNSASFPQLSESDFFDPRVSAKYGMSHLRQCLRMAGNEVSALAMYNAGSGRVKSNRTPQSTLNYIGKIISYQKKLDDSFIQEVVTFFESQLTPGISSVFTNDIEKY